MSDDSRELGVEFGDLADDLESEDYPLSKEELLETYGDREVEMEDNTTTVRELIEPLGQDEFQDVEGLKQSMINMTGDEAVGRKGYSDRGGQGDDSGDGESESV